MKNFMLQNPKKIQDAFNKLIKTKLNTQNLHMILATFDPFVTDVGNEINRCFSTNPE